MNALILAGGFGNRLKPFTASKPKPVLNVGNIPMIDYTVSQLTHFGIADIVFALAHLPERIIEWTIGYKNICCHYNIETQPLGTCGAVKSADIYTHDTFFVLSGDGISNIDLAKMQECHNAMNADVTMAVTSVKNPSFYGVVDVDEYGYVKEFYEKPKKAVRGAFINCGVYLINKRVFNRVPNTVYDFSNDLFPNLLKNNEKIAVYKHDGYWNDVGSLETYHSVNLEMISFGSFFRKEYNSFRKYFRSEIGRGNSLIGKTSTITGHIHNCVIGNNCIIAGNAVLENCVVLDDTMVKKSHANCIIDPKYAVSLDDAAYMDALSHSFTNFLDENFVNRQ